MEGYPGKIGLWLPRANPALVYATIEGNNANKGFYKSTDKGEKLDNSYISGRNGGHIIIKKLKSTSR
jgi:hypothetical protein